MEIRAPDPDAEGRAALSKYSHVRFLGKGTHAEVNSYVSADGRAVAIKMVAREARSRGVNLGAVKELQVMRELRPHPNILSLLDAFAFGDRVHLVLELCESSLDALSRDTRVALPEAAVKGLFQQLLRGVSAMHGARFMHRDIKPENVLIARGGELKLADFGHAAPFPAAAGGGAAPPLFHQVVTLWYRAPELLCRAKSHGPAVDMWAAGCVLGELLLRGRGGLFPAEPPPGAGPAGEERAQMGALVRLLGAPVDPLADVPASDAALRAAGLRAEDVAAMAERGGGGAAALRGLAAPLPLWPGCAQLPGFMRFESYAPQPWRSMHPALAGASQGCVDLLSRLLVYDPRLRLTAEEALAHPWFAAPPAPLPPAALPLPLRA
jgi:serine/threonine protein kinase